MKRQDKSAWALIFNDTGVTGAVNSVSFCMRTWLFQDLQNWLSKKNASNVASKVAKGILKSR